MPIRPGYHVFPTALGACGIAWAGDGRIVGVQLPERDPGATEARLAERFPALAPRRPQDGARGARDGIVALLAGGTPALADIDLDLEHATPFRQRIYAAARRIPRGVTTTYGELAKQVGEPGAARAVGQAMGSNPCPIIVPCHRVLAAGGASGGFSARGGVDTKLRMLAIEGVTPAQASLLEASGFDYDLATATAHLRAADRTLARLIERVGPCRMQLKPAASTFAALAEAIVYQQLNGRAAATIFGRLVDLFPARRGLHAATLLALPDDQLRAAGLSRGKLLALQDLARRCEAGEIPSLAALSRLDDDTVVERLIPVRGIGRWTVEMLLMFRLGRPDVLPVDDFGVRQGYAIAYRKAEQPSRDELRAAGEKWRPYRSVASWYFWRATELGK